jgi:hypothetical protein
MPSYTVARWLLILLSFSGSGERLTLIVMFHHGQKQLAKSVKKIWRGESVAIFDHDKVDARYIWGVEKHPAVIIRP